MARSKSQRRVEAGRELRDRLKAEGKHSDAQTVQELIISLSGSTVTLSQLHKDNMDLRRQLEGQI